MRYFIDFEAAQPSNDIISVGCVDENGREFYTLVQPSKPECISEFITELTGITKEQLKMAPDADHAFKELYEWIDKTETVKFICYGDCDKAFVKRTISYVTDFTAQCMLSLIFARLDDYSFDVMRHFRINERVALNAVTEYYLRFDVPKIHDALFDALNLKFVYSCVENDRPPEICPFPEKQRKPKTHVKKPAPKKSKVKVFVMNGEEKKEFKSYAAATDWLISQAKSYNKNKDGNKTRVAHKIAAAAEKHKSYFGYAWSTE